MKGGKGKRVGVPSARMGIVTFTTPRRFLTEIVGCRNRVANRKILILYQDRCNVEFEEVEQCPAAIQESSVKGYEQIFTEHQQGSPKRNTLNASARELYIKYCKGKSELQSSVGAFNPEIMYVNAKTSKNALRLALNLHVLWHRLDKALNQLTGPTPNVVLESTMNINKKRTRGSVTQAEWQFSIFPMKELWMTT